MAILIVAIIVIALIVAALYFMRQRQSQQLQEGFGPEYERTVEERGGDRREAEAELRERKERRREFEIRDLEPAARDRYAERWAPPSDASSTSRPPRSARRTRS